MRTRPAQISFRDAAAVHPGPNGMYTRSQSFQGDRCSAGLELLGRARGRISPRDVPDGHGEPVPLGDLLRIALASAGS